MSLAKADKRMVIKMKTNQVLKTVPPGHDLTVDWKWFGTVQKDASSAVDSLF